MKRPTIRKFEPVTRFYDPEKDETRKKIRFSRTLQMRKKSGNLIWLAILLLIVFYLILYLS